MHLFEPGQPWSPRLPKNYNFLRGYMSIAEGAKIIRRRFKL
ncbi:hypothetical Protein YC6258_02975 [Gynuella sunshinyii YC6258]|uniref:Uncharacterized protein n=1 Tax=Gynuella sunshinyii YC6258 TaxID=1445510 RepID=A0A0C5VNN7_9GAMM|nr:hypothetical Protein YC6258_02975 [Gynuella sunshinyii YC6258]